jgi:hypothetical protein
VHCAVEVQEAMPERNAIVAAADRRIELRIGINLGDMIVEGDDLYGDGVNIAARIEALADAGGVFVFNSVYDQVRDRLPSAFEDLGEQRPKTLPAAAGPRSQRQCGFSDVRQCGSAAVRPSWAATACKRRSSVHNLVPAVSRTAASR